MALVYLSLGSNIGSRKTNLNKAIFELNSLAGTITLQSHKYEYDAWGYESNNSFLNMAAILETKLNPKALLSLAQNIERGLGRKHKKNLNAYIDRIIDIDIIFYDDFIIEESEISIPHPLMHLRKFVLEPLNEIAPLKTHPIFHKKVEDLIFAYNISSSAKL